MRPVHIILMTCTTMVWGYSFIAIRVALEVFSAEQLAFARSVIILLVLLPWWKPWQAVPIRFLVACLSIGAVAFYLLFTAVGMTDNLTAVAIGTQLMAPISAIVALLIYHEAISGRKWLGILLATVGAIYLAAAGATTLSAAALGVTVLSVTIYSAGSIVAARSSSVEVWRTLAWISAIAIVPTALIAGLSGPLFPDPSLLETKHWLAVVFALLVSSLLGQAVLFSLYRLYPISDVAPYTLLVPVFTALFAVLIYGESLEMSLLLGGAIVLAGVGIQQLRSSRGSKQEEFSGG
jgi:O-acetylserine/cysteine efflux transporter